jgi:hypothetical protein
MSTLSSKPSYPNRAETSWLGGSRCSFVAELSNNGQFQPAENERSAVRARSASLLSQRDYRNLLVRREWYFAETGFSRCQSRLTHGCQKFGGIKGTDGNTPEADARIVRLSYGYLRIPPIADFVGGTPVCDLIPSPYPFGATARSGSSLQRRGWSRTD